MAEATETLELTGVVELLRRWHRVALSSADEARHREMLRQARRLNDGEAAPTEPWERTTARLGLWMYSVETVAEALDERRVVVVRVLRTG